ncbi:Ribosomal RNA small subunit methyltransferase H (16S rRNA m(4)C1402 methyltransferase) (rRNA (cytosine-N(4)-)-methyltransferase RsmH) [Durusdinium trenchii]|uniref:Ribosomal RNA small subunit methyltransferase H (16S rRNA m(4)C1402 methyltransferase) (rRNA (cytosine-N(4)-)-methyltransferase RsmH) n=1 Tax=Durusdinium trenchii TaxID=1381693 RepID=A0ABP0J6A1_9DINO
MAWPTTSKVPVPELPPQAVPQQPVGLPQQPEETPWSRYQPHTAVPLAQASTPSFRPGRSTDFDTRGRRETSMPARFARHIPCHLEDAVREMLPDRRSAHPKCRPDGTVDGLYVDCTFGRGGHTKHILSQLSSSGRLIAFDVDPEAVAVAKELEREDPRFRIAHRPFSELREELSTLGNPPPQIDGLLVDLGVSSPQLDDRHRGFGVTAEDAELDLRMNQQVGIPAWQWLLEATTEELAWVIREYGEDGDPLMADRIAQIVVSHVALRKSSSRGPIKTCRDLGELVKVAKQNYDERGMHPAKLTFQALRMFLNQEMQQMDALLHAACESLVDKGKCVVITFKKKECDAVVKFVREHEEPQLGRGDCSKERFLELYPLMGKDTPFCVSMARNPIKPKLEDIQDNPRTRSAVVHVLEKRRRMLPKISLEDVVPRPVQDRYKRPAFVPTFAGADINGNSKSRAPLRADEWLPSESSPSGRGRREMCSPEARLLPQMCAQDQCRSRPSAHRSPDQHQLRPPFHLHNLSQLKRALHLHSPDQPARLPGCPVGFRPQLVVDRR